MTKKGFVFVETIIVIALVTSALVLVYSTFNHTLQSSKIRLYYDDPVYIYKTYVVRNLLENDYNIESVKEYIIANHLNNDTYENDNNFFTSIGVDFETLYNNDKIKKEKLGNIINDFNISRMIVLKKDSLTEIRNCNSDNKDNNKFCLDLENISKEFATYLKNLYIDSTIYENEEEFNNHEYILAIEYNDKVNSKINYYSWVVL